jgi:ribosome-associated translation inhibitor RaiA
LKKESFMQIQVHSDNHIEGSARLVEWVSDSVASKLERFDDELTRIVVHLHDDNGAKAGAHDKRCQIEARPKGLQPLSVTHKSESIEQSIDGAIEKMHHALEHLFGKLRQKRTTPLQADDGADIPNRDALLHEDFLAEEQLRAV